jgi:hypothetical protein
MTYNPVSGCFWFYIKDEAWGGPGTFHQRHCAYCPFCGAKLPPNRCAIQKDYGDGMTSIYWEEIERVLGKEECDITEDEIPEEFKTEEWWKKRGL